MAPVNFEKNIREKLQERELQPSNEAWDTLSAQLGTPEEKKTNGFFWLAIAASVIGVLVISSYFLTKTQPELENQLVNETERQELIEDSSIKQMDQELKLNVEESEISLEQPKEGDLKLDNRNTAKTKAEVAVTDPMDITKQDVDNKLNNNNGAAVAVAVTDTQTTAEREIVTNSVNSEFHPDELIINNKVSEVVASVQDIQAKNNGVSMEEIDALLAQAQKDIAMERILSATKVDPQALLMDVELDLERTFRDRVFYALGEGFDYVKSTVVNGHD